MTTPTLTEKAHLDDMSNMGHGGNECRKDWRFKGLYHT